MENSSQGEQQMPIIKSAEDLEKIRKGALARQEADAAKGIQRILVGMATCGVAAGAGDTLKAIRELIAKEKLKNVQVVETGCMGLCKLEPIVQVSSLGQPTTIYGKVTPDAARQIVKDHIVAGKIVSKYRIEP
jgi:NADP-reducing hydrogenase subunit HndB